MMLVRIFRIVCIFGLICFPKVVFAFPISFTAYKTDSLKIIAIGDYHQETEYDEQYAKVIQKFLENESQQGRRSVVQIEHNVKSAIEDYKEGNYLRLLQEYNNIKTDMPMIKVIPVDQRRSGSPVKLLRFLQLIGRLNDMPKLFRSMAMKAIEEKDPRLGSVSNPNEIVAAIENQMLANILSKEMQNSLAEQFGREITLEDLLTELTVQAAALDEGLMGKYEKGSLIYDFLWQCISSLLENVPNLENYFTEYLSLEEALKTSMVDFVFNAMRQKESLLALVPLANAVMKSLEFEGDAYLASATWDLLHSENKPEVIILVGGGRHIENINPLFEALFGKPISNISFDPESVKMTPNQLANLLQELQG